MQCDYKVQLKKGEGVNPHVECALPKEKIVRLPSADHSGVKVVLIRPFLQMDVAVIVNTERQYLPFLSAELYKEDSPDTPIHVVTLGHHPFFMLPPMMIDHQAYFVQLVSSLPRSQYAYSIPTASFVANSSFIKLEMEFQLTLRSVDAEISHGTIFGLIFFVMVVFVVLNYNKLQPLFLRALEMYQEAKAARAASSRTLVQPQVSGDTSYIEPVGVRKRVKPRKT